MPHQVLSPPVDRLFEHAACGLLCTDADGLILQVNQTACDWLGYQSEALVGTMRLRDLLSVGGRVFLQTHCLPILQMQGSVAEVQMDLVRHDGERIPVLMNIVRRQCEGRVIDSVALITSHDRRAYERELLKARKAAEAALEERRGFEKKLAAMNEELACADRRKDQFLATLAHELRNPLAPIRSGLEIVRMRYPDDVAMARIMGVFDRQIQQITHLVDDLMEVSRITQDRLLLRCAPLNVAQTLKAAVSDLRDLRSRTSHQLMLELDDDDIVIRADATRLTQVVINLLTNAYKYTPEGGSIWLRAVRDGDEVVISVRDSGIGIAPSDMAAIFGMFAQVESTIEKSNGGLGIGLWLVKRLVELHGGSVSAYSAGTGQGSTFTVRLPVAGPPETAA